jgi:hypothetical protein
MSSISSRSEIRSVSSAALAAALTGGAILCGQLIKLLCSSLSAAGRSAAEKQLKAPGISNQIVSVWTAGGSFRSAESDARRTALAAALPSVESIRVSTLMALAATPYYVENRTILENGWRAIARASTAVEAQKAKRLLLDVVESSHKRVFAKALSVACGNAAVEVGFNRVETVEYPDGQIRVIATDPAGRALVTEIDSRRQGNEIQTEVVGVMDGSSSCVGILKAFDRAMEAQGVRSAPPKHALTGGVCSLDAAREFVRKKVRPVKNVSQPTTPGDSVNLIRRTQRLNPRSNELIR